MQNNLKYDLPSKMSFSPGSVNYDNFKDTPEDYQTYMIRILAVMAYAENVGGTGIALLFNLAPDVERRYIISQIGYEEIKHARMVYRILNRLGISENTSVQIALGKTGEFNSVNNSLKPAEETYGDEENQWLDVVLNCFLMDGAGIHVIDNYAECSFQPLLEICRDIISKEEKMHVGFGQHEFAKLLDEHDDTELILERYKHWYSKSLNFFGPPDGRTAEKLSHYYIKPRTNDQLRKRHMKEIRHRLGKISHKLTDYILPLMESIESQTYPFPE